MDTLTSRFLLEGLLDAFFASLTNPLVRPAANIDVAAISRINRCLPHGPSHDSQLET